MTTTLPKNVTIDDVMEVLRGRYLTNTERCQILERCEGGATIMERDKALVVLFGRELTDEENAEVAKVCKVSRSTRIRRGHKQVIENMREFLGRDRTKNMHDDDVVRLMDEETGEDWAGE